MWFPKSADDIFRAIDGGSLPHESAHYEYKAALPVTTKNRDIAVDVAAMATTGGIIIYGVTEDKKAVKFTPTPIDLEGAKDRISDVVTSNLQEPVQFDVQLFPLADDPGKGFVVIDVPASSRAPHMVEVRGEHRYYGRSPGGNRLLSENDVARLYARRERLEQDARAVLDDFVADPPIAPGLGRGDLFVVARPLTSDDGLRERVWPKADDLMALVGAVRTAQASVQFARSAGIGFAEMLQHSQLRPGLDGVVLENPIFKNSDGEWVDRYVAHLEVGDDGTVRYFRASLANSTSRTGAKQIHEATIAQFAAQVLAFCGQLYDVGGYHGSVVAGLAVVGAAGAVSSEWLAGAGLPPVGQYPTVPTNHFRKTARVSARQLLDDPSGVAGQLVGRLLRTVRLAEFPDPLALEQ